MSANKRRRTVRRRYTDDDRTFALRWLDANRGNVSRTARELGIPVPTLHQWDRGARFGGAITRSKTKPLALLYHFQDRKLPVACLGKTVHIDPNRLNPKQRQQLSRLLALAQA